MPLIARKLMPVVPVIAPELIRSPVSVMTAMRPMLSVGSVEVVVMAPLLIVLPPRAGVTREASNRMKKMIVEYSPAPASPV